MGLPSKLGEVQREGISCVLARGPPCKTVLPTTKVPDGCIGGSARGLGSRVDGMGFPLLLLRYPVGHQGL